MNNSLNDYHTFLMMNLSEINDQEFDNESQLAYEVCITLGINNEPIPEFFYKMYTCNININEVIMTNAIAYFTGCNLLSVECDCPENEKEYCNIYNISDNRFFQIGELDMLSESETWTHTVNTINTLKYEIFDIID